MTVRRLLLQARRTLQAAGTAEPALEAEVLAAHCLGRPRSWLFAHPEAEAPPAIAAATLDLVRRRAGGEPLEYLTGSAAFYGLTLEVTPDVLVPRPETEILVDLALAELADAPRPLVVDVGTGSGAVALALAARHPGARIVATDVSLPALAVARRNARSLALSRRVPLVCCDLLAPLSARFDLIAANLPYVGSGDLDGVSAVVARHEPRLALDGGADGLALIERLLRQATERLRPGGTLLAEIGSMQGSPARALAEHAFAGSRIDVLPDPAGLDRVLRVRTR